MNSRLRVMSFVVITLLHYPLVSRADNSIAIEPTYQREPTWCWAAVSEMIFRYYEVSDISPFVRNVRLDHDPYQCGIVSQRGYACAQNCYFCSAGIGKFSNMQEVLWRYPVMASRAYGQQPFSITSTIYDGPLSNTDITREIDAGRPIIAGISPGQQTPRGYVDHVVLIVGYEQGTNADLFVIVNDPFPFDIVGMPNPYVSAGATSPNRYQYRIESHKFAQVMNWTESASNIQRGPATSGAISVWEIAMLLVSWLFIFMSRNSKWAFLQKLN